MVTLFNLKYLATQKSKDAEILFSNGRYNGSIYMMGYALELMLKWKISKTLGFKNGFPEDDLEMKNAYTHQLTSFNEINTGITLHQIKQIRHHTLTELIKYSGIESTIVNLYYREWVVVCGWHPINRYKRQHWTFKRAQDFMNCSKLILSLIS